MSAPYPSGMQATQADMLQAECMFEDYLGLADADAKASADRNAMPPPPPPPPPRPTTLLPGASLQGKKSTALSGKVPPTAEPVFGPKWWVSKVRSPVRASVHITAA